MAYWVPFLAGSPPGPPSALGLDAPRGFDRLGDPPLGRTGLGFRFRRLAGETQRPQPEGVGVDSGVLRLVLGARLLALCPHPVDALEATGGGRGRVVHHGWNSRAGVNGRARKRARPSTGERR